VPASRVARAPAGLPVGAIVGRLLLIAGVSGACGLLLGAMFLPAALAADDLVEAFRTDVLDLPPLGEADVPPQNSYVFAADGEQLAELTFEENRVPVALADLPRSVVDAVLATEDANFYEHSGVNHLAIARAAFRNFQAGSIESGASTITQQYVKLTFLSPEQTIGRKIEEAIYAIQLERQFSKDQILERYLNRAYFGSGTYGIGTAAERYFSKDVRNLTLGESAMLAGLLRAPEANNPIRSLENAQARRDIVLRQMATHGFVTSEQASAAIRRPLVVDISEPPPPAYPFWVDWVSRLLVSEDLARSLGTQVDALEAMGATPEERRRRVYQQGLRIHTTLDPQLQAFAEQAIADALTYEEEPPEEVASEPAGAIVTVEPGTGAIRAMAVGPHAYGSCVEDDSWVGQTDKGQLLCDRTKVNPAVSGVGGSGRQPGSSFKPFLVAAALESGLSPGLTMDARGPQEIPGCGNNDGEQYTVNNSGGDGILNMYQAVQQSSNVYMALLIGEIGPARAAQMAERLTGYPIPERDVYCPLALGATEITPLAMANGYATLANRGIRCDPFPITRIENAEGKVIWEYTPTCERVLDTEVADRVVDMLKGPVSAGGTAPGANLGRWATRGKTGTTNDNVDAWFVGFVRQLATAAWVGYPNGPRFYVDELSAEEACGSQRLRTECPPLRQTLRNVTIAGRGYARVFGGTIPAPMWAAYMRQAVEQLEPANFPDPGPIPAGRVPDLLSATSIEEAERLAQEAGFRLMVEEVSDYRAPGTFVGQVPAAGEELGLGSPITLEVSDGTGEVPKVPDVLGLTLEEATAILTDAGYRVVQRSRATDDPVWVGRVIGLIPGVGTPLAPDDPTNSVTVEIGVLATTIPPGPGQEPGPGDPEPDPTENPSPDPVATDPRPGSGKGRGG
jgi:penicillin-binding protein 1A